MKIYGKTMKLANWHKSNVFARIGNAPCKFCFITYCCSPSNIHRFRAHILCLRR